MSRMEIMDPQLGDTKVYWDKNKPQEVENARENFDRMRKKGYAAYRMTASGSKGEQIRSFDPSAERIILGLPLHGG